MSITLTMSDVNREVLGAQNPKFRPREVYLVRHAERLLGTTEGDHAGPLALARITELRVAQGVAFAEDSPQTPAQRDLVLSWRAGL